MIERIVVTGIGVISSLGAGREDFESVLFSGASGIGPTTLVSAPAESEIPAYEIRNFEPQKWLGPKGLRVLDRSTRLLCVAAQMALSESALNEGLSEEAEAGLGLVCGTLYGSIHSITAFDWSGLIDGPKYVNPMEFPNTVINSPTGQAAIRFKLKGTNSTISAGLASSLYAINYATDFLRLKRASVLLAGGVEELCEESYLGFAKNNLISPTGQMRPFARERDGIILGEGSAICVLETEEHARRRGAVPVFEICGFGAVYDGVGINGYDMKAEGAAVAMREALRAADVVPEDIGLIIAGANGSRAGDKMEAVALRKVFGCQLSRVPVSAPKAAFGEAQGASGALLAVAAGLGLARQQAPPTSGFSGSEDGLLLSSTTQPVKGEYALINSFGCDGNNTSLVVKRWSE